MLEARNSYNNAGISLEQLREIEEKAILETLNSQRQVGIDVFTDGEYRRSSFLSAFAESVEGLTLNQFQGENYIKLNSQRRHPCKSQFGFSLVTDTWTWRGPPVEASEPAKRGVVGAKLKKTSRLTSHESLHMKSHAPGPFKITIPSAGFLAPIMFREELPAQYYPTVLDLVWEIAAIIGDEVKALVDEEVPYFQLDAPGYSSFADEGLRQEMHDTGLDPDQTLNEMVEADNSSLQGAVGREGVTLAVHLYRSNSRSRWRAEGSYEPIAEKVFNTLQVDRFLLEFDTERAGGFEPLRFVPRGKTVVLGLITTKHGQLEQQDDLLRRIEEASSYVPVENLALSPQCGFASGLAGNLLSHEDQGRKLELVADTARKVWG